MPQAYLLCRVLNVLSKGEFVHCARFGLPTVQTRFMGCYHLAITEIPAVSERFFIAC